jgi:uncharacterized protein (DUF2235 family)
MRGALIVPLALLLCCTLPACTTIVHKAQISGAQEKHVAVFFDGTNNDIAADTNIKKLHSLVSLQNRNDLATLYVEGVGTKTDVLGMGTGFGVKPRVILAYAYLLENYNAGQEAVSPDSLYLFGFSRGAYQARILASLLNTVGMVSIPTGHDAHAVATLTYDAFKADSNVALTVEQRRTLVRDALLGSGITMGTAPVRVKVLGLWDSVEALGVPDWAGRIKEKLGIGEYPVNVDAPNLRYGDQLCNVDNAFHALSIDDNREWVFTPLLLARRHLYTDCLGAERFDKRNFAEVWFAGAHSDVGGGYDDSLLSGVSLNWMIKQVKQFKLLPDGAAVAENRYGSTHDPEASMMWGMLYHAKSRDIVKYVIDEKKHTIPNSICVHDSVFDRRQRIEPKEHENTLLRLLGPAKRLPVYRVAREPAGWAWTDDAKGRKVEETRYIDIESEDKCAQVAP